MQYKKIEISDKPIFEKYYKKHCQRSGFLSFVTLFTWQAFGKFRYCFSDDELFIRLTDNDNTYLLPQTDKESIKKAVDILSGYGKVNIKAASKEQVEILKELYPERFSFEHKRNEDNYYYLTENLISLSGKKLHSKRNFINRFKKDYSYTYEPITEHTVSECIEIARLWCERKNCSGGSEEREITACEKALLNMNALALKGGAIRIDGKIAAFALGEQLNDNTVLVHFEKADTEYNGIYQMINNEFLKNEWKDTTFVNREEDMGVLGLRQAKMSYYPEYLLESYEICDCN